MATVTVQGPYLCRPSPPAYRGWQRAWLRAPTGWPLRPAPPSPRYVPAQAFPCLPLYLGICAPPHHTLKGQCRLQHMSVGPIITAVTPPVLLGEPAGESISILEPGTLHVPQPGPCIHPSTLPQAAAASDRRGSPAPHHANRAAGSPMAVRGTLTKHHAHHHAHHLQPHHLASSSSAAASAAHALALESALARKGTSLERSTMQGSPRSGLAHAASAARGGTWAPPGTVGRAAGWLRVASVQDLGQLRETVERDGSIGSEGKQVGGDAVTAWGEQHALRCTTKYTCILAQVGLWAGR